MAENDPANRKVSQQHCDTVSGEVKRRLDDLFDLLNPKIELIIQIETSLKMIKWFLGILIGGGAIWKGIDIAMKLNGK